MSMGSFNLAFLTSYVSSFFFFFFFGCVCDPSAAFWRNDPVGETKLTGVGSSDPILLKIRDRIILHHSCYWHAEKKKIISDWE